MIPVKLTLSNFTSYGENVPELRFTKFHLAAISGPNGAGKSSLLDAITWCLWGTSRAGDSSDQLVHLGAQNMFVEFSFSLDGHTFIVKRQRSLKHGGSSALEFWSGKNNLTEGIIKTTQQKIIDTLHLTFETFTNSSFLRQGHADEFTTKGPTDRKRILADILGLSHYDKLEEKAKEKVKDLTSKLKLLEYQFLEIEAELSQKEASQEKKILAEKKITEIEIKISSLEKELKSQIETKAALNATYGQQNKLKQTLTGLQTELNEILSQGKMRAGKIKTLEKELEELPGFEEKLKKLKILEKEKEEYTTFSQKKLELENKLTKIKSALALKNQERENLGKKLEEIKSHLEALSKEFANCPTCGQEIGKDNKHKVIKDLRLKIKELEKIISGIKTDDEEKAILKLQTESSSIKLDDHKYQETLKKLQEISLLQGKREKLIADQATLESEKKVVVELRELFKNKKSQIEKLEQDLNKLPNLADDLTKLEIQVNQKELELNKLRTEEKEARNLLGQATELISRSEQLEKLFEQKKLEKNNLEKEKGGFEELTLAFGKKGIQAMIIETAIPEIETEANRLLAKLTSGRMNIRLQTQKETKTKMEDGEKGIVETLDIIISDEMGEREYSLYSGGEAFRVNFAIRIALSKLLTRRAGAKLQFLVIDEGFGTQDAEGRTRIVEVLDTIKNDFEKILIITHLEELKEEFPVRIEVSKNSGGSTFEVVGT
ncbi:MAG: Uncharacterized protein G01um10147_509 [Microgenomates group bacterium Gr01-1014_7]|nr:MAG: Uncharacterized protein G01um10147_509 [Microgenomates group bacterium Gr01-1014_7]